MTGLAGTGAIVGLIFGLGALLIWTGRPAARRPGLAGRVAPYLKDTPRPSRLLDERVSTAPLAQLAAPLVGWLGGWVERVLGGAPSVRQRLLRAGRSPDVDRFRATQVLWGAAGAALALVLGSLSIATRGTSVSVAAMLVLLSAAIGVVARDQLLTRQAQRREQRMLVEFPTVAELLALAVGAGEGAVGALERVCRMSQGELATELQRCLADARAGASLPHALQGLGDRTGLPSLARFVDGIVVAVERGTPLAEVLRAQAQDVREESRRAVMEQGGKKEIEMMIPVVFLILPVTVLFAVYPGFAFLKFSM
jgi:tight adherence protein C